MCSNNEETDTRLIKEFLRLLLRNFMLLRSVILYVFYNRFNKSCNKLKNVYKQVVNDQYVITDEGEKNITKEKYFSICVQV